MTRFLLILPLMFPTLAQAACPTRADLAEGIVLVQNWPFFRRADVQDTARGLKEERRERIGGGLRYSLILYAHGLLSREEQSGSGLLRTSYHGNPRQFDQLAELGEVALTGTRTEPDGRKREITVRATYLDQQIFTMGDCHYDVVQLLYEVTAAGRSPVRYQMSYAPGLGLVLAQRHLADDGKEIPVFGYNWIGTKADVKR